MASPVARRKLFGFLKCMTLEFIGRYLWYKPKRGSVVTFVASRASKISIIATKFGVEVLGFFNCSTFGFNSSQ
jgi:hypothetical protein